MKATSLTALFYVVLGGIVLGKEHQHAQKHGHENAPANASLPSNQTASPVTKNPNRYFQQRISAKVVNKQYGREKIEQWIETLGSNYDFQYNVTLDHCYKRHHSIQFQGNYQAGPSVQDYVGTFIAMTTGLKQENLGNSSWGCRNTGSSKYNDYCNMTVEIFPANLYKVGLPHILIGAGTCKERTETIYKEIKSLEGNSPLWTAAGIFEYNKKIDPTKLMKSNTLRFGAGQYDLQQLRQQGTIPQGFNFECVMPDNAVIESALWTKVVSTFEPPENNEKPENKTKNSKSHEKPGEQHIHWWEAEPVADALNRPQSWTDIALTFIGNIIRPQLQ